MKHLFTLFSLCLSFVLVGQGVNFLDMEYDDVVRKAKAENKLIFVDVYADWCVPCQKMDREVFPDAKLGAYINEHFVSYKANAKTSTGNMLARKHGVGSYPHYLFIDTKGTLVYKSRGYMSPDRLIEEAQVAANPAIYNKYQLFKKKYNAGSRDKDMLGEFLELGYKRYKEVDPDVFAAYFKQLDLMDKQREDVLVRVAKYVPYANDRAYDMGRDYYIRIKDDTTHKDRTFIKENLLAAVERSLEKDCQDQNDNNLDALLIKKEEMLFEVHPMDTLSNIKSIELSRLQFHQCSKDTAAYREGSVRFVEAFLWDDERFHRDTTEEKSIAQVSKDMEDAAMLAEISDQYIQFYKDKDALFDAESWIKQAIRWDDRLEYHATLAFLTDALGDKGEAVNIARRALERARKEKHDYAKQLETVLMTIVDGKTTKGVKQY